ncbi:MAG: aldo/keto reductase [Firmicutes bacterium]|nr:aldo/keto reductase [Bacillota bacterium]
MMNDCITLSNGVEIPRIGFGSPIVLTYMYGNDSGMIIKAKYWTKNFLTNKRQFNLDRSIKPVLNKLGNVGCHMIDTSRAYAGSERCIGNMLRTKKRDDYFIITKLCNRDQMSGDIRESLIRSLKELHTDYIDLYLMHWPVTNVFLDTWKTMEKMYSEGLCRAIGVANCNIHHLEEISQIADVMPMVNQIECHPLLTQNELRAYCTANHIQVMAYTPTARMDERLRKTKLADIAAAHQKSMAQVILRWHTQLGTIPVVNTGNVKHLKENFSIFDFSLSENEMQQISAININSRLRYDPDNCDFSKL